MMKRSALNFTIDAAAFAGFIFLTTTGVLLHFVLPPGSGRYTVLWGLDRHQWGTIHYWTAIVFFAVLALHLSLHWRWITGFISGRNPEASGFRLGLGLVGLITLTVFAMAPLIAPVEISTTNHKRIPSSHPFANIEVRGSMTIQEAARKNGVPPEHILKQLNVPESAANEKLGKLKRTYQFDFNTVRKIISDYKNRP